MNVRELIYNLEIEKQQLENENKLLRKENNELKKINKKLVDDWNSILPQDTDNDKSVVVDVQESIQTTETSNEESIEEEPKQKKSSRKKKIDVEETPVDEVVSLM